MIFFFFQFLLVFWVLQRIFYISMILWVRRYFCFLYMSHGNVTPQESELWIWKSES